MPRPLQRDSHGVAGALGMHEARAGYWDINGIYHPSCVWTIYGYWWKGTVSVYWYRSDGRLYDKRQCFVPTWNPFNDLHTCTPDGG